MDFYVDKDDCSLVTSYNEWLDKQNLPQPKKGDEWPEEAELIGQILSLDYCHWVLRRTAGGVIDGSNCEDVWHIRKKLIKEFEEKFNKSYFDANEGETH